METGTAGARAGRPEGRGDTKKAPSPENQPSPPTPGVSRPRLRPGLWWG